MFYCESLIDVYDFGVVVFGVSVGVLSVLVDDFVGFLEDFGAGCGFIFWCGCHGCFSLSVLGVLGWFLKNLRGVCSFFGSCGRILIFFVVFQGRFWRFF